MTTTTDISLRDAERGIQGFSVAKAIITPNQDAVVSEIQISAPPHRVFQALTNRRDALQWGTSEAFDLTEWEMDARQGGSWRLRSIERKGAGAGKEFKHHGEILEIDPPRLLVYTWFANWHEDPSHRTVVRWDLSPSATGTHVKVTHSNLGALPAARKGYSEGWPGLLEAVKKHCESNNPQKY